MKPTKVNNQKKQSSLKLKKKGSLAATVMSANREIAPSRPNESVGCQEKARVVKVTITGNYFSISLLSVFCAC